MWDFLRATSRPSIRAASIATLIGGVLIGPRQSSSQTLELTQPLLAPALPKPSFASTMVEVLEIEAHAIQKTATQDDKADARAAIVVQADIRLLAAELLAQGDRAAADGSAAFVAGLKLAAAREALDDLIMQSVDAARPPEARDRASAALASLHRGYSDHVQRGEAPPPTHRTTYEWHALLLARLMALTDEADGKGLQSHWIESRSSTRASTAPNEADALASLRARLNTTALDNSGRQHVLSITDFLERGRQFPELAPQVEHYRAIVTSMLDSADTIAAAQWLGEERRGELLAQVTQAAAWFLDPQHRAHGIDAAQQLQTMSRVVVVASRLENDNVDARTLRGAFASSEETAERATTSADARRPFTQLAIVLERMLAYRQLDSRGLTKDLRQAERELAKTYRESEENVLKALASGDALVGTAADPAFTSLLEDHRQRLEDLQRLRRMPDWSVAIAQIHPPAAKDFEAQIRRWSQALLDPNKRPATILTVDRFEDELAMFERLPFEQALREHTPVSLDLTGGLAEQVLAIVTEKRRAWADQWCRPEIVSDASDAMTILHRLLQSMRDAAALSELDPEILNRWPAWQLDPEIIARGQSDVVTRLKLACAALVQGELTAVREQIDRLDREAPLAKLAGRMMHVLGNELRERPASPEGVLAQLVIAPADGALLLGWRADVERLCHYASEADAARARGGGHADAAREIDGYVHALASRLLAQTPDQ